MHEGEPGISMSAVADTSRRTAMASADGIEVKGGGALTIGSLRDLAVRM